MYMQELQHEVSSLLEFKNAVLETFPHLHNRFGGVSPGVPGQRPLSAQPSGHHNPYPGTPGGVPTPTPAHIHLMGPSPNNNANHRSNSPHVVRTGVSNGGAAGLGLPQPYRGPSQQQHPAEHPDEDWNHPQQVVPPMASAAARGVGGLRARSKPPPVVIRKSPENSNSSSGSGPGLATSDSGFNSEPKDHAMTTAHLLAAR